MADETPPSEAVNELTVGLDGLDATGFVRALRSAWRRFLLHHPYGDPAK